MATQQTKKCAGCARDAARLGLCANCEADWCFQCDDWIVNGCGSEEQCEEYARDAERDAERDHEADWGSSGGW